MKKPSFFIFAGPCVLENEDISLNIAHSLEQQFKCFGDRVNFFFKGSFDKANRTSVDSYRGPGLEHGLRILEQIKKQTGLKVMTDFHLPDQASEVASVCDAIQIPAFLCRQTDMILAGAQACIDYKSILKIKKGQFLSPEETVHIIDKANSILDKDHIILTERGSSFGYNNLIVDMASFQTIKSFGVKVIHDATHCVQRPGALGNKTGGKREQILVLARAAVAAGADGIFMEVYPQPERAKSDASTSLELNKAGDIIKKLLDIYQVV